MSPNSSLSYKEEGKEHSSDQCDESLRNASDANDTQSEHMDSQSIESFDEIGSRSDNARSLVQIDENSSMEPTSKQEESPMTVKIRAVVNDEVDRIFESRLQPRIDFSKGIIAPISIETPTTDKMEAKEHIPSSSSNPIDSKASSLPPTFSTFDSPTNLNISLDQIQRNLQQYSMPSKSDAFETDQPLLNPSMKLSPQAELIQENLREIQRNLVASRRPNRQLARLPGRHQSFVDAETERVSKIMMGSLGVSSRK